MSYRAPSVAVSSAEGIDEAADYGFPRYVIKYPRVIDAAHLFLLVLAAGCCYLNNTRRARIVAGEI